MEVVDQTSHSPLGLLAPSTLLAAELASFVTQQRFIETEIEDRSRLIEQILFAQSRYSREPNFTAIHPRDLEILFKACDQNVFRGYLGNALGDTPLRFRLSARMTSAGGRTTRFRTRDGKVSYEIAISCSLLFQGFSSNEDRAIHVCGLRCDSRLHALLRIFEHELVHLIEYICWSESHCAAARFQDIAARFFGHRAHTHELITWKERALTSGIRAGSIVSFVFEGVRLQGRVNRVTKRVTVLVEDACGRPYSDGRRYRKYYVPLAAIEPAAPSIQVGRA